MTIRCARPSPIGPAARLVVVDARPQDYRHFWEPGAAPWEPCVFTSGEAALHGAEAARPAVAWLVSARLPDMSGLELARLLRGRLGRTPVFLVADAYSPTLELESLRTGWLHFVCKPLSGAWLESWLQPLATGRPGRRGAAGCQRGEATAASSSRPLVYEGTPR